MFVANNTHSFTEPFTKHEVTPSAIKKCKFRFHSVTKQKEIFSSNLFSFRSFPFVCWSGRRKKGQIYITKCVRLSRFKSESQNRKPQTQMLNCWDSDGNFPLALWLGFTIHSESLQLDATLQLERLASELINCEHCSTLRALIWNGNLRARAFSFCW